MSSYPEPDALPEPLYAYPVSMTLARIETDTDTYEQIQITDNTQDKIQWRDPSTGVRYLIDSRTGNSYPADDGHRHDDEDPEERALLRRRTLAPGKARGPAVINETPAWLTEALKVCTLGSKTT